MIKRMYSLSVRKINNDGNGSYSYNHFTFHRRSWFSKSEECFRDAMDDMEEMMKDKPGKEIEVVSFSRI